MLLFRLCTLGVGGAAHPRELKKRLNAREIAEWIAYERIEPFGSRFLELLHGIQCAVAAEPYRKEGTPPPEPTDFMPTYEPAPMTPEQMARNLGEWRELSSGDSSDP